ncbi:MAG: hypothetical protein Kow00108_09190 [Calditrichia bacterium]
MYKILKESKGFTLLEILVAMIIFGVVAVGIGTTVQLFLSGMQFTNEQSVLLTQLDKLTNTMEMDIGNMTYNGSENVNPNPTVMAIPTRNKGNVVYEVRTDPYTLKKKIYYHEFSSTQPYVDLSFEDVSFRYYYYIPTTNTEVIRENSMIPLDAERGSLRVIEMIGEIENPTGEDPIEFRKSFFVDYKYN